MPASIRNVAYLPLLAARVLKARGREEGGRYYCPSPLAVKIDRPLERQPLGVVQSDPFLDVIRASRVFFTGPDLPDPRNIEPEWHVRWPMLKAAMAELMTASTPHAKLLPAKAVEGADVPVISFTVTTSPLSAGPATKTLNLYADCRCGTDGIVATTWRDCLYLSMVLEVAARAAGLGVGHLSATWTKPHEASESVLGLTKVEDPVVDAYRDGSISAPAMMVGPELGTWLSEVEMLRRGGVIGLSDPACRGLLAPAIAAQQVLGTDSPRRFEEALKMVKACPGEEWRVAFREWIDGVKSANAG